MYEIDAEKRSDVERSEVSLKVIIEKYKGKNFSPYSREKSSYFDIYTQISPLVDPRRQSW